MKTHFVPQTVARLASVAVIVILAGCATANYQKGTSTSVGLTEAANRISLGNAKIDMTLAALNDMVANPQGDLPAKYAAFNASVRDLTSTVASISAGVSKLGTVGSEYFADWDKQLTLIQDPDIRAHSAQRKAEVEKEFLEIRQQYAAMESNFHPFVSYLKDIQLALGTDLNANGVASIRDDVTKAGRNAQVLKASIERLTGEFRDLGTAMASKTVEVQPPAAPQPVAKPQSSAVSGS